MGTVFQLFKMQVNDEKVEERSSPLTGPCFPFPRQSLASQNMPTKLRQASEQHDMV